VATASSATAAADTLRETVRFMGFLSWSDGFGSP